MVSSGYTTKNMNTEVPRGTSSINQTRIVTRIFNAGLEYCWCHYRSGCSLHGSLRSSRPVWVGSAIEIFASIVVVWQLLGINQHRERLALRLIGAAFFALAVYILAQITVTLLTQTHPLPSMVGIVWLAATFIAMLLLAYGKHVTGKQLGMSCL